jgi:hypothetical protein
MPKTVSILNYLALYEVIRPQQFSWCQRAKLLACKIMSKGEKSSGSHSDREPDENQAAAVSGLFLAGVSLCKNIGCSRNQTWTIQS